MSKYLVGFFKMVKLFSNTRKYGNCGVCNPWQKMLVKDFPNTISLDILGCNSELLISLTDICDPRFSSLQHSFNGHNWEQS